MSGLRLHLAALSVALLAAILCRGASAETDEAAVRNLIEDWYIELRKGQEGRPWRLTAPGAMILPRRCPDTCGPQSRALNIQELRRPRYLVERAQRFTYDVERLRIEHTLARADVWERGWNWAAVLKKTTESAASAIFILEKGPDKGWKILVYRSELRALRPSDSLAPMPDLSPKAPRSAKP